MKRLTDVFLKGHARHYMIGYIGLRQLLIICAIITLLLLLVRSKCGLLRDANPTDLESVTNTDFSTRMTNHDWQSVLTYLGSLEKKRMKRFTDCRDVYGGVSLVNVSHQFASQNAVFNRMFEKAARNSSSFDGHVGQLVEQMVLYYQLAKETFVSNICEIGFNGGHSALVWLTSNPTAHVYSFDLGEHVYSRQMARFLTSQFPGRLTVTFGDSRLTVPSFRGRELMCDILVIDGGHTSGTATADLKNLRLYANPGRHILIFDDYPSKMKDYMKVLGKVWIQAKHARMVSEIFSCLYQPGENRGFTIGKYKFGA